MADLAERVRSVMEAGDLDGFLRLCAEDVHWGPPDDPSSGCRSRQQVRSWYEAAFGRGVRAEVCEVVPGPSHLLVGVSISGSPAAREQGGRADRWQVMAIRDGSIADICGFDDRAEAAMRAGVPE